MPVFKAPLYMKKANSSGDFDPCYRFPIEMTDVDDSICFTAETDVNIDNLQHVIRDNLDWWRKFLSQYIQSSSKYFSKQYTVDSLNKCINHTLERNSDISEYPVNIVFIPKEILIHLGKFILIWRYEASNLVIDVPDNESVKSINHLPVSSNNTNHSDAVEEKKEDVSDLKELDLDELPPENGSLDERLNELDISRYYQKQKVKEARLRAKLAAYKAEREMNMYYTKYGADVSDSDESDSDGSEYTQGED